MKKLAITAKTTSVALLVSFALYGGAFASWQEDGNPISTAISDQRSVCIAADGAGGAILVWEDCRSGEFDLYIQRIDLSGNVLWEIDGAPICTTAGNQYTSQILADGVGGAYLIWAVAHTGDEADIFAQRVNSSGSTLWTPNGIPICTFPGRQSAAQIAPDGAGGIFITWMDERNGGEWDLYGQRVNALGEVLWAPDGLPICTAAGDQLNQQIVSDGDGGVVIVWSDERTGSEADIYAQRVDSSGLPLWALEGVPVCTAPHDQGGVRLTMDGQGGAIAVWRDNRFVDSDLYIQRIDEVGNALWAPDGIPVCSTMGSRANPSMIAYGSGEVLLVWEDNVHSNMDIFAQRMDAYGNRLWGYDGIPVCNFDEIQMQPKIISDGASGAIVTWADRRTGAATSLDIFAQRINESGNIMWQSNGVVLCDATDVQSLQRIVSDGSGGAIVAWQDNRTSALDIYAQRVTADGAYGPTDLQFTSACADGTEGVVVLTWEMGIDVPTGSLVIERAESAGGEFFALNVPVFKTSGNSFTCTDNTVLPRKTYWYRIVLRGATGEEVYGPIRVFVSPSAATYHLHQSFPNPFNPVCTIRFEIPRAGRVKLRVFDASGTLVRTLVDGWREPAEYSEVWDGRADDGAVMPSGVYFCEVEADDFVDGRKMVLVR